MVAHGLLRDPVIVSDDAGQFNVGRLFANVDNDMTIARGTRRSTPSRFNRDPDV